MRYSLFAVLLVCPVVAPAQAQPEPDIPGLELAPKNPKFFADLGSVTAEITPAKARRGQAVVVKLTVSPKLGAHTYPTQVQQTGKNKLPPDNGVLVFADVVDPAGWEDVPSKVEKFTTDRVYSTAATWELKAWVARDAKPGKTEVNLLAGAHIQICTESCLTARAGDLPPLPFEVLDGEPAKLSDADEKAYQAAAARGGQAFPPKAADNGKPTLPSPAGTKGAEPAAAHAGVLRKKPLPPAEHEAKLDALKDAMGTHTVEREGGISALLLTAAFWGLVSLATPCVFPMIPITVSLFLKQSNQSTAGAVKLAAVYSLTIVVVLGLAAVLLLSAFRELSVDPYMNVFLGGLFVYFTLSLFGMYEATIRATLWYVSGSGLLLLAIASWGVNPLPAVSRVFAGDAPREDWLTAMRAVGMLAAATTIVVLLRTGRSNGGLLQLAEARRKQGGLLGVVIGAVMFSIVSFTCVAPFLGGFAGMTASGQYTKGELVLAGLTFASAFAAPFFVLALFPSLLKSLPKSGGWLDSVKVVMGFLEVAAALKFFRTAEIRWSSPTVLFTYDLVIAGWVVIAVACGLYLLNVYRLPHDEEKPNIGVPRLMFALLFLGFGLYLMPAMFKSGEENNRPRGVVFAWVDAFLLPEPGGGSSELPWNSDLPDALDRARSAPEKKLVFVDFTGETCTNCKANEKNVFPKPAVKSLLDRYQLASMYTDDVPSEFYTAEVAVRDRKAEGLANLRFQRAVFGTEQLPLYAVLQPTETGAKVLAVYPGGLIGEGDVAGFVEFLGKPLGK